MHTASHHFDPNHQSAGYLPHYRPTRSNAEYGVVASANPTSVVETSFDSRLPNPASANNSNVQIVCRINAPSKQSTLAAICKGASAIKRPNSASRIHFQPSQGPAFKARETSTSVRSNQLKINPSRSFMSVQSTPALRSPSLEYSRHSKRNDGFVPLRGAKIKPANGIRFPSGNQSPMGHLDSSRKLGTKPLNQSNLSHASSNHKASQLRPQVITPTGLGSNGLRQESKYSVFTTTQEKSKKVIVSETPISARIINDQLKETAQLDAFMQTCATNGYDANAFDFDNVFSEVQKQDKFYAQSVKPIVQAFVEGENGTVIFFGPSQSGKTYSLNGKAGKERGVVPRAIEDVLSIVKNTYDNADMLNGSSMIEDYGTDTQPILSVNNAGNHKFGIPKAILQNSSQIQVYGAGNEGAGGYDAMTDRMFIKMSVYMIYCDKIYDLLCTKSAKKNVKIEHYIDPSSAQVVSKFTNMTEKLVLNLEQYYALIQDAFKERKTVSMRLTDHDIRKRSHLVISLSLVTQTNDQGQVREISRLNFTELCGSEQSVAQGGQVRDTSVRQFVTKSFNGLSTQVLKSALGKRTQLEEGDSGLVGSLKTTLTSKSNILMVACASPIPQFFDHSLPAIKFCARIRDTIVRKLQKQGFQSGRNHLEESEALTGRDHQTLQPVMKQTRFNLDVDKQVSAQGPLSTFGRVSQHSERQECEMMPQSSLKKPNQRKHSRSSSPIMNMDEIVSIQKQLQGEVQMYDALTREFANGNKEAVDLDEVREWSMRNLETINKALFSFQKRKVEDCQSKNARDDAVNSLFYLKERITSIEKQAMTASPFRSVSPKGRDKIDLVSKFGHSVGTTSAASIGITQEGRDNPFNQIVHGISSAQRSKQGEYGLNENSNCSSVARRINDPSYFSSVKDLNHKDTYRTYDAKRDQPTNVTQEQEPYSSKYGRELSERLKDENRRVDGSDSKVPQSAREGNRHAGHTLRDFSRSGSRGRGSETHRVNSPTFMSGQVGSKKQTSLVHSPVRTDNNDFHSRQTSAHQPKLQSARDQLDLQLIQDKFLSSQRVQHIIKSTFGEQQAPKALYANAEETLADIQRLIMLEDFDGLRRRVMQLFKERQSCDDMLQTQEVEIEELREQLDVRDDAVKHIERLNERNLDEYMRTIQESTMSKEKNETQTSMHIHKLQETIEAQTCQLDEIKTQRVHEEEKFEHMTQQYELNNRLRQEAESKVHKLQEENDKLYTNYDVLKEHELNIIKDFQDRKVSDQSKTEFQIEELKSQIEAKNGEINDSKKQITDLETELRRQGFETQRVHEQKTLQDDAQGIIQSKLDREKNETTQLRDKIQRLENELDKERNNGRKENTEKQLAYQEIKQLQDLIAEMEKTIHRVSDELREAKSLTEDRQGQINELDTQKRVYEERMSLKDKEMESCLQSREELCLQLAKLQQDFDELDNKHVKLRAAEFDKVDVLKVNAELEGKTKNLQIDIEHLIRERNTLQDKFQEVDKSNTEAQEAKTQLTADLDHYKRQHEMTMDKFDQKFTEFSQELGELSEQNSIFKEKEKKFKRTIHNLELRNLELEEKMKYAHIRNTDLNAQVDFVERDMQKLAKETGQQVQIQIKTAEKNQARVDATDRAFTDIKSMISQFRHERNNSKERSVMASHHRGVSGDKYSREGSPEDAILMRSARQLSSSPDGGAWQRQKMSPLRNHSRH